MLNTPFTDGPIVPGVMRGFVHRAARALGIDVVEDALLTSTVLNASDEVFLTNSVRGIMLPMSRGCIRRRTDGRRPGRSRDGSWDDVFHGLATGSDAHP